MKQILLMFALAFATQSQLKAQTFYDLEQAKTVAKSSNKLLLVDFTATWCGPCKEMDREFWHNDQYQNIVDKFVVAKIDIDENKQVASYYSVNSIPNIKIINIDGTELYGFLGFEGVRDVENKLKNFPPSVGDLYESMTFENAKKPTSEEMLFVASSFQAMAQQCSGEPQSIFIGESNSYFKKCLKLKPEENVAQKAALGKALNLILVNKPEAALKEFKLEQMNEENKPFAIYLSARSYVDMKDQANARKFVDMLQQMTDPTWKNMGDGLAKKLD